MARKYSASYQEVIGNWFVPLLDILPWIFSVFVEKFHENNCFDNYFPFQSTTKKYWNQAADARNES